MRPCSSIITHTPAIGSSAGSAGADVSADAPGASGASAVAAEPWAVPTSSVFPEQATRSESTGMVRANRFRFIRAAWTRPILVFTGIDRGDLFLSEAADRRQSNRAPYRPPGAARCVDKRAGIVGPAPLRPRRV